MQQSNRLQEAGKKYLALESVLSILQPYKTLDEIKLKIDSMMSEQTKLQSEIDIYTNEYETMKSAHQSQHQSDNLYNQKKQDSSKSKPFASFGKLKSLFKSNSSSVDSDKQKDLLTNINGRRQQLSDLSQKIARYNDLVNDSILNAEKLIN